MNADFPLVALRLRFTCVADNPLTLGGLRAGSRLRGALLNVMRRTTCTLYPQPAGAQPRVDPEHAATCPVCWLIAANERPGQERRGYVLTPPQDAPEQVALGSSFDFHLTLLGEAIRYLPYFILAVPEAGRRGLGPGRARFHLQRILAEYPLGETLLVLESGEQVVRAPNRWIDHLTMEEKAARILAAQNGSETIRMTFDFYTPLRLVSDGRLLKQPQFAPFFAHLLLRLDELAMQFCQGRRRNHSERQHLMQAAEQVRLVEHTTRWAEVRSGSTRTGRVTWISGLVGRAVYSAAREVWQALLPWLLWGEIVQVGKDTAKGNGAFCISWVGGDNGHYSTSGSG